MNFEWDRSAHAWNVDRRRKIIHTRSGNVSSSSLHVWCGVLQVFIKTWISQIKFENIVDFIFIIKHKNYTPVQIKTYEHTATECRGKQLPSRSRFLRQIFYWIRNCACDSHNLPKSSKKKQWPQHFHRCVPPGSTGIRFSGFLTTGKTRGFLSWPITVHTLLSPTKTMVLQNLHFTPKSYNTQQHEESEAKHIKRISPLKDKGSACPLP